MDVENNIDKGVDVVSILDKSITLTNGYISSSTRKAVNGSATYRYTDLIPVKEGQHIITNAAGAASTIIIAAYSATDEATALSEESVVGENPITPSVHDYIVPSGVNAIRCCFRNDYIPEEDFYIKRKDTTNLLSKTSQLENDIENVGVSNNAEKFDYTTNNGYITRAGVITPTGGTGAYVFTNIINVTPGQIVETAVCGNNTAVIAAYDESSAYVESKSLIGNNTVQVVSYVVPEGITAIRVSWRKADVTSPYVHIKDKVPYRDAKINTYDFISNLHGIAGNLLVPINVYNGKCWYNGQLTNVTGASCYAYDVSDKDKVYVTTVWNSASGYYPTVVFFNDEDEVISTNYYNQQGITTSLYDEEILIPEGAAYMYVIARYLTPSVKVLTKRAKVKKDITILFIGNSLTQDAISCLPYILVNSMPDVNFRFYVWYCGGYNLAQHYEKFINDQPCDIYSIADNNVGWYNISNSMKMSNILKYKFDMVCIQEYFNYKESYTAEDLVDFNNVVNYLKEHCEHPFKVATLFHQPKRDVADSVFNLTKQGNGLILRETVADSINPAGIAIYRAMQTSLDSLGDRGHLSPDGTHAQEGLPCLLQAYVSALWICDLLSLPYGIVNDKLRITTDIYNQINVPGPNLGTGVVTGTEEQHAIAQEVAVKAWKEGKALFNANLTDNI